MGDCSEVCGDFGASSGRAEVHVPPRQLCGFSSFFLEWEERMKRRREKKETEGVEGEDGCLAWKENIFSCENSCTVLR